MSLFNRSRSLQSPKYAQKRRKKTIGLIFLLILSLILFTALFIFIIRIPFFQINNIEIVGNSSLSIDQIKETALASIQGNYYNIIPMSNVIFYPKKSIEKILLNNFSQ